MIFYQVIRFVKPGIVTRSLPWNNTVCCPYVNHSSTGVALCVG